MHQMKKQTKRTDRTARQNLVGITGGHSAPTRMRVVPRTNASPLLYGKPQLAYCTSTARAGSLDGQFILQAKLREAAGII